MEQAGADHLHVSIGSIFPHPLLPSGGFPPDELNQWYGIMGSSGTKSYLNYAFFHFRTLRPLFLYFWNRTKKHHPIQGLVAPYAREVKKAVQIPVICTGGFQDARLIRQGLNEQWFDAVSIGRPLVANNDLPKIFESGKDLPDRPCSFCNRCLVNAVYNPLGCYDVTRFDYDQDAMIREVMSVFNPSQPPYVFRKGPRVLKGKTYKIKTKDKDPFQDLVRKSPVDRVQLRFRRNLAVVALAVVIAAAWLVARVK